MGFLFLKKIGVIHIKLLRKKIIEIVLTNKMVASQTLNKIYVKIINKYVCAKCAGFKM